MRLSTCLSWFHVYLLTMFISKMFYMRFMVGNFYKHIKPQWIKGNLNKFQFKIFSLRGQSHCVCVSCHFWWWSTPFNCIFFPSGCSFMTCQKWHLKAPGLWFCISLLVQYSFVMILFLASATEEEWSEIWTVWLVVMLLQSANAVTRTLLLSVNCNKYQHHDIPHCHQDTICTSYNLNLNWQVQCENYWRQFYLWSFFSP